MVPKVIGDMATTDMSSGLKHHPPLGKPILGPVTRNNKRDSTSEKQKETTN